MLRDVVEFGAAAHHRLALQVAGVEVPGGKGGAVGRHQELGPFQEGGLGRHQAQLDGPVAQGGGSRSDGLFISVPLKLLHAAGRTYERFPRLRGRRFGRRCPGGRAHKLLGFPRFNGQGSLGALPQAGPQTVTKAVRQQLRLAVHDLNGPFGARRHAHTAAVALVLVYPNDLSGSHEPTSFMIESA